MKSLKSKVLTSLMITPFLLGHALNAHENVYQVPGNLQIEVQTNGYNNSNTYSERHYVPRTQEINNLVCYAIKNQKRMEMTVETQDIVNKKEMKIVIKKLIIEPYAFGMTSDGKPVFYGKVAQEKLDREATVKYGEDKYDDQAVSSSEKKEKVTSGWFGAESKSAWFNHEKNNDIDMRNIKGIKVIEDSHFDAPKDYPGYSQTNVQIICQLPLTKTEK